MNKISTTKPLLIMLYGFPGAGKSHFAKQLAESLQVAHVHADRIRHELFEKPRHDKAENEVITHLMGYMTEEFLAAGVSVIYDTNVMRKSQRKALRELARKAKAGFLLVWLQIDAESAFQRTQKRDRRKVEDKYAMPLTRADFEKATALMQNPSDEDYVVISGKHTFHTQKNSVVKRLYEMGVIHSEEITSKVVKPELVNLIPNPLGGRVDVSRRNIRIH
jgi:predicted kinase